MRERIMKGNRNYDEGTFLAALIGIILIVLILALAFSVRGIEPIGAPSPETVTDTDAVGISVSDAEVIAQILYHECRGLPKLEQSAVVWTILNRVDSELAYFPDTVYEVCTQKMGGTYMFAYRENAPVDEDLYKLACDVLERWEREKRGETDIGRTLPREYVYFWGNGKHNYFRIEYQGRQYWDWSLPDPYRSEP